MEKKVWVTVAVLLVLVALGVFLFKDSGISKDISTTSDQNQETQATVENNQNQVNQNSSNQTAVPTVTEHIDIDGFSFGPQEVKIRVGDEVVWKNFDSTSHTVTSDSGSELDSGYISRGGSYSHKFTTPGIYKYHCKPHPYMKGTIRVE